MEDHNRTLLVLCDSRQDTYPDVDPGVISALDHWGMPYRRHDLSDGQPVREEMSGCVRQWSWLNRTCARP